MKLLGRGNIDVALLIILVDFLPFSTERPQKKVNKISCFWRNDIEILLLAIWNFLLSFVNHVFYSYSLDSSPSANKWIHFCTDTRGFP